MLHPLARAVNRLDHQQRDFLTLLDEKSGDFVSLLHRKICGLGRAVLQGLAFAVSFDLGGFLPDRLIGRLRELRAGR